jgi:F-type H+-transporting ATPase subunit epsilon
MATEGRGLARAGDGAGFPSPRLPAELGEAKIQLEVVTPRGVALRAEVDEVIAPSVAGEFGVLPGHLPLLAALKTGLVRYRLEGKLCQVAVGAGFVEINQDTALLLTDRFLPEGEVDVAAVRARLEEVDREIDGWQGELHDPHRLELIEEEQWLAAQLELGGQPPVPTVLEASRAVNYADVMPPTEPPAGEAEPHDGEGVAAGK